MPEMYLFLKIEMGFIRKDDYFVECFPQCFKTNRRASTLQMMRSFTFSWVNWIPSIIPWRELIEILNADNDTALLLVTINLASITQSVFSNFRIVDHIVFGILRWSKLLTFGACSIPYWIHATVEYNRLQTNQSFQPQNKMQLSI